MTGGEVLAWLESRRPAPPAALLAPLEAAVTDRAAALPDHLAAVGHELPARAPPSPRGGRELALALLAADAFVTYAFEAQAEADVGGLAALVERVAGDHR